MVPLDPLWDGGFLTKENLQRIADADQHTWCGMASQIFQRMIQLSHQLNRNPVNGIGTVSPPDLLAAAVAIEPHIAAFLDSYVFLETRGEYTRGMTVLDRRTHYRQEDRPDTRKVKIAISADQKKYADLVFKTWL